MSLMRRAMEYLGLGGEDLYDDYPQGGGRLGGRPAVGARGGHGRNRRYEDEYEDDPDQGYDEYDEEYDEYDPDYDDPRTRRGGAPGRGPGRPSAASPSGRGVRPQRSNDSGVHVQPIPRGGVAARGPAASAAEAVSVRPVRYEEAKDIGDLLKSGKAVKMDIGSADEDTARRLIDFASGLVYATEGSIDRVAAGVFVLRPRATRTVRIG